jgi:hypothetical protein
VSWSFPDPAGRSGCRPGLTSSPQGGRRRTSEAGCDGIGPGYMSPDRRTAPAPPGGRPTPGACLPCWITMGRSAKWWFLKERGAALDRRSRWRIRRRLLARQRDRRCTGRWAGVTCWAQRRPGAAAGYVRTRRVPCPPQQIPGCPPVPVLRLRPAHLPGIPAPTRAGLAAGPRSAGRRGQRAVLYVGSGLHWLCHRPRPHVETRGQSQS